MAHILKSLSQEQQGTLYALASGLCYGLLGYFGMSLIHADLSVFNMLFWRFLISGLFIGLLLIPHITSIEKQPKEILKAIFYGVTFYSASSIIYFMASKEIGSGLAMVIFFIYPSIVIFLGRVFYKSHVSKMYYLAALLIMVGMLCLVNIHAIKLNLMGLGLGVIAAGLYAGYIVVSKENQLSPLLSTFMVSMGCVLTCLVLALFDHSFALPRTINAWGDIFGIAIICTALPILFLLQALQYISPEKVSLLSVLEPICVVLIGAWLLGERLNMIQILGISIILSGALLTLLTHNAKPAECINEEPT